MSCETLIQKREAQELVEKFIKDAKSYNYPKDVPLEVDHAKQCAIISMEETLKEMSRWKTTYMGNKRFEYLLGVQKELKKL